MVRGHTQNEWGPRPAQARRLTGRWRSVVVVVLGVVVAGVAAAITKRIVGADSASNGAPAVVFYVTWPAFVALVWWRSSRRSLPHWVRGLRRRDRTSKRIVRADDPLGSLQRRQAALGGGAYLGVNPQTNEWVTADRETAVLVLGPPRSGKTSCIMIPAVLSASGPVVSTSTKPEILHAAGPLRASRGTVWHYDPAGADLTPPWAKPLAWSPVPASIEWDRAVLMARSMVASARVSGRDVSDASHWTERGTALLAPLLHAAAIGGRPISELVGWVLGHNPEPAAHILVAADASPLAQNSLGSIMATHERERSSIYSTVANVLGAYNTESALALADAPNFDPAIFVSRGDTPTVFITAAAEHQALVAPLVVGLLEEIRNATYAHHRLSPTNTDGLPWSPVLFALDEAANIAPLPNLPALVSEAGGQGLQVLAAFQDLSQARHRWSVAGDGFLSLFSTKVVLGGIGDPTTVAALETLIGDWDRPIATNSRSHSLSDIFATNSKSWTTQRAPVLTAAEIATIPTGKALAVRPNGWGLIQLTPYHSTSPWAQLTTEFRQLTDFSRY